MPDRGCKEEPLEPAGNGPGLLGMIPMVPGKATELLELGLGLMGGCCLRHLCQAAGDGSRTAKDSARNEASGNGETAVGYRE